MGLYCLLVECFFGVYGVELFIACLLIVIVTELSEISVVTSFVSSGFNVVDAAAAT